MFIPRIAPFHFECEVDADKSITHRALILAALAEGRSRVFVPSLCDDCRSTLTALRSLGARIEQKSYGYEIIEGIKKASSHLNCNNSGTTARLLIGALSSQKGVLATFTGDSSLSLRPMSRIVSPLTDMGAEIHYNSKEGLLPLQVRGCQLKGIEYSLPIASAQIKSAILLAGLGASSRTILSGKINTRNHTELLLSSMRADISYTQVLEQSSQERIFDPLECTSIGLKGDFHNPISRIILFPSPLKGLDISISGDFSSAMYFLAIAILAPNSSIRIKNVNINPTRTVALQLLQLAGARIYLDNIDEDIEKSADLVASSSKLSPFVITENLSEKLIDELPLLAVMACFIEGESIIEGAGELRYKESDRIKTITEGLRKMGADIAVIRDNIIIHGKGRLKGGASVSSFGDHRIEMSLAIAAALSEEGADVEAGATSISFGGFYKLLGGIIGQS